MNDPVRAETISAIADVLERNIAFSRDACEKLAGLIYQAEPERCDWDCDHCNWDGDPE